MNPQHALTRTLTEIVRREYALPTGSGTTALFCALRALGIPETGGVILPSIVCPSVLLAVLASGAIPTFCDVRPGDVNMDPGSLRRTLTPRIRVVIPVHSFGMPCDLKNILAIATEAGCVVLEDFAQGFGNEADAEPLGSSGTISITSFGREKLLDAGGGGALFTNDPCLYREAASVFRLLPRDRFSALGRLLKRLSLAWSVQSNAADLRRRALSYAARQWLHSTAVVMSRDAVDRILQLIQERKQRSEKRRSRLTEVILKTSSIPCMNSLSNNESVLTMATFLLPFRPTAAVQFHARSKGLFFLYRPLHQLYSEPVQMRVSAAFDGRLANISLSPDRPQKYLTQAIAGLLACVEAHPV